jgi:hypothetical protein
MASKYEVNKDGVAHARKLIDAGNYDTKTPWGEAAPSAAEGNQELKREDWEGYEQWFLAVDPDASEETKKRYAFPYGDYEKVNRSALIHAKQRASQNGHTEIEKAADDLLGRLDAQDEG